MGPSVTRAASSWQTPPSQPRATEGSLFPPPTLGERRHRSLASHPIMCRRCPRWRLRCEM